MKKSSTARRRIVNLSPNRLEQVTELLNIDLKRTVQEGVTQGVLEFCQLFVDLLMNTEAQELAGERYKHDPDRQITRWGKQDGTASVLGQRMPVKKQRLRDTVSGTEVEMESYKALNEKSLLNEENVANMIAGVSTRRLSTTVEGLVRERGVGRQSVSRRGIEVMSQQLDLFRNRSLADKDILVIFIDGIGLGKRLHIAAVGVDRHGKKHLLGVKQGATENSGVCKALLADLAERGLSESGEYLFVIDGSKALAKAVREVFGIRALIQRCLLHKIRNVYDYLPKHLQRSCTQKIHAAYSKESYREAEKSFDLLRRELVSLGQQSAADSLIEGLQDLLTLHKLHIKGVLRKSLRTTNCIESIFSAARYYTRNVKRWRNEEQMDRWLATGLLEAEKHLKRIPGYTQLPKLRQEMTKAIEKAAKKSAH